MTRKKNNIQQFQRYYGLNSKKDTTTINKEAELSVTEKLNKLRLIDLRKERNRKGNSKMGSMIDSEWKIGLDRMFVPCRLDSLSENTRISGPPPPKSWLIKTAYRPEDSLVLPKVDTLYYKILNLVYKDINYLNCALKQIKKLPTRIKKDLLRAVLPRVYKPEDLVGLFKDSGYSTLDLSNIDLNTHIIIDFLGQMKPEFELLEDWEDSFLNESSIYYLRHLKHLNLSNNSQLSPTLFRHLEINFQHLISLNLENVFLKFSKSNTSLILINLSKALFRLRWLNLYHDLWKESFFLELELDWHVKSFFISLSCLVLKGEYSILEEEIDRIRLLRPSLQVELKV